MIIGIGIVIVGVAGWVESKERDSNGSSKEIKVV